MQAAKGFGTNVESKPKAAAKPKKKRAVMTKEEVQILETHNFRILRKWCAANVRLQTAPTLLHKDALLLEMDAFALSASCK